MKQSADFKFEKSFWKKGLENVVGMDEVGRGSWAGPLVACAVIFPTNFSPDYLLFDSKMLSPRSRSLLAGKIKKDAIYGIGSVDPHIIDEIGISQATQLAFQKALKNIKIKNIDFLLIDAFSIKTWNKNIQLSIKKGDQKSASIAAASIVAKEYRDEKMIILAKKYPHWGFEKNKGYGTDLHKRSLKNHQFSEIHRRSFKIDIYCR